MYNIKELCNILPYEFSNYKLRLASFNDIDWYIDNCMKQYFNEFIDNRFSDYRRSILEKAFYEVIKTYVFKVDSPCEGRLILIDKNNNSIVGGVTLFEKVLDSEDIIEIAYFILPKSQGKGIAYIMLYNIIYAICKSNMKFAKIAAVIREDNIKSINLIKKLNFSKYSITKGKYKNNITYIMDRPQISGK